MNEEGDILNISAVVTDRYSKNVIFICLEASGD